MNVYVTEPPPTGKILLETSKGDIEIELWAKEAPKAVRNIITLALEGYYDDCLWHRVVPGFCIQTGDPTGTGSGGESCYGEPFETETHQRLRFNRRGLVAMANTGEDNTNESQFFITLDPAPELQNKHTIFGRVEGPTIYNVLSLADVELSATEPDRPVYPPKLLSVRVLENPFDDIVPRITRQERLEQEQARRDVAARREREESRRKVKKNTGLLSFGEAEEVEPDAVFKGPKSSHDLLKNDKRLAKDTIQPSIPTSLPVPAALTRKDKDVPTKRSDKAESSTSSLKPLSDLSRQPPTPAESADAQIRALEDSIRGLTKRTNADVAAGDAAAAEEGRKKLKRGRALLDEARAQYATKAAKKDSGKDSTDTFEALMSFRKKLKEEERGARQREKEAQEESEKKAKANKETLQDEDFYPEDREYGGSDDDDDDWRNHTFDGGGTSLPGGKSDGFSVNDYAVLDPRDTTSKEASKMGLGATSKDDPTSGRQGRDWVAPRHGDGKRDERDGRRGDRDGRDGRRDDRGGGRDRGHGRGGRGGGKPPKPYRAYADMGHRPVKK